MPAKRALVFCLLVLALGVQGADPAPLALAEGLSRLTADLVGSLTEKPRAAVADFQDLAGQQPALGASLADSLAAELAKSGKTEVVPRAALAAALAERKLSTADLLQPPAQKSVGEALGLDWLVLGTVADRGADVELTARAVSVKTGEVAAQSRVTIRREDLLPAPPAPPAPPGQPLPPARPLQVSVSFLASPKDTANFSEIKPGTVLHTGDRIKIMFSANQPCHVYILQIGASGNGSVLFPSSIIALNNPIPANTQVSIPPREQWFVLDQTTGLENIYFVASLQPVKEVDKLLASIKKKKDGAAEQLETQVDQIFKQRGLTDAQVPTDVSGSAGYKSRSLTSADTPTDVSGTAGFKSRDIGGVSPGPSLPLVMDGETQKAESINLTAPELVGRQLVITHEP